MLGYFPWVVRHIREHSNTHHFVTFTSGFTSVTNSWMLKLCYLTLRYLKNESRWDYLIKNDYFSIKNKDEDVWLYLDGIASNIKELQREGIVRRFIRSLIEIYRIDNLSDIIKKTKDLIEYFQSIYPGKKDEPLIQKLKGLCREWESSCLWGYFGWNSSSIENLRLGFYTGDIFTEEPTVERDVKPVLDLLRRVKPDIITSTLDPEGAGPDTHYKVLQILAEALKIYVNEESKRVTVIGYRNIWHRFHPAEANIFVPVSLNMLTLQHGAFMKSYITQKKASFPHYAYDGPFSKLAQIIQTEQYQQITTFIGKKFFHNHQSALIRATRGFVFLKKMSVEEFFEHARTLKKHTE